MQEVMQADYYINKLVRRDCSNSNELVAVRGVFEGVLGTIESREVLSLHFIYLFISLSVIVFFHLLRYTF